MYIYMKNETWNLKKVKGLQRLGKFSMLKNSSLVWRYLMLPDEVGGGVAIQRRRERLYVKVKSKIEVPRNIPNPRIRKQDNFMRLYII